MSANREPIAIIGIGCKTPGNANNHKELWDVLLKGVDGITDVPPERWNKDKFYDPDTNKTGKTKTARGGFINGIDKFDNEFFNIFPKEAENIDPMQRLLLQATFEALEDAGDRLDRFRGSKTAVYIGSFANDYQDILADPDNRYRISPQSAMGISLTSLANRISYLYDLKGPSIAVDTACSASLVAIHLACQSIWLREAKQAIAGGVNLNINPALTMMLSKGNFLSADGTCKSFDESGNGYVRGEGVGLVYLKPLTQALADNNKIYALVRGSACNSDGFTPAGFTVPNPEAQTEMLQTAYRQAGIDPQRVQYIEAHGTGTSVGDPLETQAFANVFSQRPVEQPLLIGSIKSNLGHLEGAAGVTGLIKLALCLHHKQIPANLHFNRPNPKIDFENWRLKVVDRNQRWPAPSHGRSRIGGVNSFGAGGTNAHVVLEEYIPDTEVIVGLDQAEDIRPEVNLFSCSAQTPEALKAQLQTYLAYLSDTQANLNDICFNAGQHRSLLRHRLAIAASSTEDLGEKISAYLRGESLAGVESGQAQDKKPRLAFVFTGQGPQWYAMGRQLIDTEPVFRHVIATIDKLFVDIAGWSLLEEMSRPESESQISDTRIAQPAIMALQIALVELWKHNGIEPEGVIGHSIGEVAAAYTAGALTLEQAVQVIFHRSRGQHAASGKGVMLAVGVDLPTAETLIANVADRVSIAAINGPESITLSGDRKPLDAIASELEKKDVFHRFLKVDVPFHSHHMGPLKEELIASLSALEPTAAQIALYSTVSGKREDGLHLVSDYWYQNVRDPVYFSPALQRMVEDGFDMFIEIGPHPALSSGAQELFTKLNVNAQILPSIRRQEDEAVRLKQSLGALLIAGHPMSWHKVCPGAGRLHDLPRYAWQEKRFWNESRRHQEHRLKLDFHPNITQHHRSGINPTWHVFNVFLDSQADPYLSEHRMDDLILFPGAGILELAMASGRQAFGESFSYLMDISFERGLFLPDEGEPLTINLEIDSASGRYWLLSRDGSKPDAEWIKHANGIINYLDVKPAAPQISLREVQRDVSHRIPVQPTYNSLKRGGLSYGPAFKTIQNLWSAPNKLLAKIVIPDSLKFGLDRYFMHPALMDTVVHSILATRQQDTDEELGVYLPVHIERYHFFQKAQGDILWSYLSVQQADEDYLQSDVLLFDDAGNVVAQIIGLRLKYIIGSRSNEEDIAYSGCYEYGWHPVDNVSVPAQPGTEVLLIADVQTHYRALANALKQRGATVITLGENPAFDWPVDLQERQAVLNALGEVKARYPALTRIVNLLPQEHVGEHDLAPRIESLIWKSVNINHAIIENELQPVLWTINCGSEWITPEDSPINLIQAPLYGVSRTMNNEYPLAVCKVVDLGKANEGELSLLAGLITAPHRGKNETELAIRGEQLFARRLKSVDPDQAQLNAAKVLPGCGGNYHAVFGVPGVIGSLQMRQFTPAELQEHEIELAIKAAALNRRTTSERSLSHECSGVITRIGSAVSGFKTGDRVIAITANGVAGITRVDKHYVTHKPAALSFEQAALLPIACLTAWQALFKLARIKPGERVLIHCAHTPTGLACVHLAQQLKADVFASADTDASREQLRSLGITHVYDSTTLSFHQQIMTDTQGAGVDIVLNNLSGKGAMQSLRCLQPFGRFIALNPHNQGENEALSFHCQQANFSYFAVDVLSLVAERPHEAAELFAQAIDVINSATPMPLPAYSALPVNALPSALGDDRQSENRVVTMEGVSVNALPAQHLQLSAEKTYLITGGASGLGIVLATWLVEHGARKLVLASRSGPKHDEDRHAIALMRQQGVEVLLPKVDLSSSTDVMAMIEQIKHVAPLGGVIHGAAVMQNALIGNLQRDELMPAFEAKALGAWHLHQALQNTPLEFFLSLSSIASVFGFGGQTCYSAANNFIDKLTHYRQMQGLTAQAINIGVLGQFAGLTKDADSLLNLLDKQGWLPMSQKQVTAKIEQVLLDGNVIRMAANIDWARFREHYDHLRNDLRFAHLLSNEALQIKGQNDGNISLREKVQALSGSEAVQELKHQLTEALARILGTTVDKVAPEKSLSAMGLDSLMLNQLRHWIQQKLEINYPLMRMVKGPSLLELAEQLYQELTNGSTAQAPSGDISGITSEADIEVVHEYFVRLKRAPNEQPKKTKLFMMPSMGAGASMFAHFLYNPPADCEVYAIQSPGRENRLQEENHTQLSALLSELETAFDRLMEDEKQLGWEGDIAFFGHSYGGIVMFELYRALRAGNKLLPVHFFSSATMAPQLTGTWKNRESLRESGVASNSEQKILGLLTYIDDLEFVKQILPGLRRDMPLLLSYEYQHDAPLSCPITVFSALEDEVTLVDEMTAWEAQTTHAFQQFVVHGDHWFVSRNKDFIGEKIAEVLAGLYAQSRP